MPRPRKGLTAPLSTADDDHLYSVAEAAELLHLSEWKIRDLIAKGKLSRVEIDHSQRVRAKDLRCFIKRNHKAAP